MSGQERTLQGVMHTLRAWTWLLFIAMFAAGCGGGGNSTPAGSSGTATSSSSSSSSTSSSTSSSSSSTPGKLILKANAGSVCETLVPGETYTGTIPSLSCNYGSDPYTAYLDGSKSSSSDGQVFSYSWSFNSKPAGSQVVLQGANTAKPTFKPDKAGSYAVQLVISAQGVTSSRAVTEVVALDNATVNPDPMTNPVAVQYHYHGGLSGNCSVCHAAANPALQTKPSTHIATSNMCQTCHTTEGFIKTGFVDHKEVFGKCSDCHNGVIATGKSSTHIVTTQECSDCHNTTSFVSLNANGTFDHSNITEPCSSCHNGKIAVGTDADPNAGGHPSISVECNSCHNTVSFAQVFVNHSDPKAVVPGTCGSAGCHQDGSTYTDVNGNTVNVPSKASAPNPHPDTGNITQACDLCHNTTSFNMGGVFDHGVLARHPIACKSCHDGVNAKGKISNHIATSSSSDCSNCHNTSTFVGGFVDHATDPSVIGTGVKCTDCHDGTHTRDYVDSTGTTVTLPIPGVPTTPQTLVDIHTNATNQGKGCGDCHTAGGSFALATVDHSGFGSVGNITPGTVCSDCHDGSIATGKPANHLVTAQDCGACHDPQSDNWAGAGFDHSTISIAGTTSTPTCVSCHDGSTATGQSATHVPTSGQDCLVCHGSTGFTSFALASFDHAAAGINSNCVSCHDGQTHDGIVVVAKPTGHIPTSKDCSDCHDDMTNGPTINGTSSSGFATATPFVNTVHPAYTTGCRTCHNVTYNNSLYQAKSHPIDSVHDTVDANGWECNACHTTTGNFKETNPVNHQDPSIKAQACVSCHAAGNTTEPIGKGPSHPATSDACQDCHQAGGSFTAGFDHTTLDAGGVNNGLACTTCHDGVTATGKPQNHVPTTRDCISCHAGYPPNAATFAGGTFDHTGPEMTGKQCMDCHDGVIATGKTATHIATNQDCGACHTTDTFANATSFDHTGVTSGCQASGCHNEGNPSVTDVTDDPNPLPHIPVMNNGTEVDCYNCHKNPGGTFANAVMDHSVVGFEGCESCHDGKHDGSNAAHVATTQSSSHIVSKTSSNNITACATCHTSTSDWTQVKYKHSSSGNYPGDHSTRRVTSCTQCHTDTNPVTYEITTFDNSSYTPYCAVCHLSQFKDGHGGTPDKNHQDCGKSGCHNVGSSSFG